MFPVMIMGILLTCIWINYEPNREDWQETYANYLRNPSNYDESLSSFVICDIDRSGIPELSVSMTLSRAVYYHLSGINGKIVSPSQPIGSEFYEQMETDTAGMIISENAGSGLSVYYCMLENGEIKRHPISFTDWGYSDEYPFGNSTEYVSDYALYRQYKASDPSHVIRSHNINEENIQTFIYNWESDIFP
jgi:hypothetical protein